MDRSRLLRKMTAEQFAAFDVHLYLDTHPHDMEARKMHDDYQKNFMRLKAEFEALFGPITADGASGNMWEWTKDPWPWETEAN